MGIALQPNPTEQQIDRGIQQQEKQHEDCGWSREATLLMLSFYKALLPKIDSGRLRKKKAFEEVSEKLMNHMLFYSADKCSGRLKTLLRAYKSVKDHNSKSGNDRKSYLYEKELDEMFGDRPNVSPVCTINSSDHDYTTRVEAEDPEEIQIESNKRSRDDSSNEEKIGGEKKQKVGRKTQVSEVLEYLQKEASTRAQKKEDEEKKKDRRHNERMSMFEQLISVLKDKNE